MTRRDVLSLHLVDSAYSLEGRNLSYYVEQNGDNAGAWPPEDIKDYVDSCDGVLVVARLNEKTVGFIACDNSVSTHKLCVVSLYVDFDVVDKKFCGYRLHGNDSKSLEEQPASESRTIAGHLLHYAIEQMNSVSNIDLSLIEPSLEAEQIRDGFSGDYTIITSDKRRFSAIDRKINGGRCSFIDGMEEASRHVEVEVPLRQKAKVALQKLTEESGMEWHVVQKRGKRFYDVQLNSRIFPNHEGVFLATCHNVVDPKDGYYRVMQTLRIKARKPSAGEEKPGIIRIPIKHIDKILALKSPSDLGWSLQPSDPLAQKSKISRLRPLTGDEGPSR